MTDQPFQSSAAFLRRYGHSNASIQPPQIAPGDVARLAAKKPNRRELAKALTLAKVKAAARFLFLNVGYEATTIRDLADRIGMSTGAVFSHYTDKAALWTDIMGCPTPTLGVAEEFALIQATRPDWRYLVRWTGQEHFAQLNTPDWNPLEPQAAGCFTARAASPGEALRQVRMAAERHHGVPQ